MVRIGNHLKMNVPERLRARTREFYGTVLECRSLESPRPDLDLYELSDGFVLGLFFTDEAETLSDADYLKATWMGLKVEDPRFFFQAPGGAGVSRGVSRRRAVRGGAHAGTGDRRGERDRTGDVSADRA